MSYNSVVTLYAFLFECMSCSIHPLAKTCLPSSFSEIKGYSKATALSWQSLQVFSQRFPHRIAKVAWASRCIFKEEPRAIVRANQEG